MNKKLKGLITLTAFTGIGLGVALHTETVHAEEQALLNNITTTPSGVEVITGDDSTYIEDSISDEVNTTTPDGAGVSDISEEIKQKYASYFDENKDVTSIQDIIRKVYKCLDNIDVKNNPDFSNLKDGLTPYNILCDIQKDGNLDDKIINSIKDATQFYDIYCELSKDGGYVYNSYCSSSDIDFESIDDTVSDFLLKYDYTTNVNPDKFKQELEAKLNNGFELNYNKYDETIFQVPTISSTGYVYVNADLTDTKGNMFKFSYETILQKLKSQDTGSSSGSHHHSSGGSSSGGSKSSSSNSSDTTSNTSENTNTQNTTPVANNINIVAEENAKILKDSNGNILTGWQKDINGNWYLANEKGEAQIGWYQDNNGSWYYLQPTGVMKRGWYQDNSGSWYLLREDGAMATGWYKDTDGSWYYLNSNGSMAANTTIDGYAVGSNGAWVK